MAPVPAETRSPAASSQSVCRATTTPSAPRTERYLPNSANLASVAQAEARATTPSTGVAEVKRRSFGSFGLTVSIASLSKRSVFGLKRAGGFRGSRQRACWLGLVPIGNLLSAFFIEGPG